MHRISSVVALMVLAAACGGSDEPAPLTAPDLSSPTTVTTAVDDAATDEAAESAIRQLELGGVRSDLDFDVVEVLFNAANTCAGVLLSSDPDGGEPFLAIAYMVRTAGRSAEEIFPRVEAMNPTFLERWDAVVGDADWGMLALFPAERDMNDVATLCSGTFLDQAERRFAGLQIETVE